MKTLAVIPARLAATRLPGKPLQLLGGLPLIVRVWERVSSLDVADRVVVATDSEAIASVARGAGAECVMTSADHPSGTDRVAEVAARAEYARYEAIVNVQGDEPFIPSDAVRGAAALVRDGRFPLGTASSRATPEALRSPNVVKVVCDDSGRAMYFSRASIPWLRDVEEAELQRGIARQHIGVYVYERRALARWVALDAHPLERIERLEQLRPLAAGIAMGVAPSGDAPARGIDTEEDLLHANARWHDFIAERT